MSLIPESIRNATTENLDNTFAERLKALNITQLIIDLEQEKNAERLGLWLEMFNVDLAGIDFVSMSEIQKRSFIRAYMNMLQLSGTPQSIVDLCKALGATSARIENNWQLTYNGEAKYDGLHKYDGGQQYKQFAIDIIVQGVNDLNVFKSRLKTLFNNTQPIKIYVRDIRGE